MGKLIAWRWASLALTIGLPVLFLKLNERRSNELHALVARGVHTQGITNDITQVGSKRFVHYRYRDGEKEYDGEVDADRAPGTIGVPIEITYLPEDPSKHWAGSPLNEEVITVETKMPAGVIFWTAAIAISFVANEFQLRRHRAGLLPFVLGPRGAGNLLAVLVYGMVIGVNFDPKVRAVQERAFGARPLGLPNVLFMALLTTLLYLPFIFVFRHASILVHQARLDGRTPRGGMGFFVLLLEAGRRHPHLRRSQAITTFGFIYFLVLMASWIAYAAHLGI